MPSCSAVSARSIASRLRLLGFAASLGGLALVAAPSVSAQIDDRPIPFDCGGWLAGFAQHSSGRVYAYGDVFGVWRSDDAGQSWRYLQGDLTVDDNQINGLAVASGDADRILFRTKTRLWRSTNGGTSWDTLLTDLDSTLDRGSTPVVFHPTDNSEIWLAGRRNGLTGSLWRSIDGGSQWIKVGGTTFDSARVTTLHIHPNYPDQILVGAVGGFYVSTDRGSNWRLVWNNNGQNNPAFPSEPPIVRSIARRADGVGYFAANIGGFRVSASNYADRFTYDTVQTVNRVQGSGPVSALALADGSFVTTEEYARFAKRSSDGTNWTDLGMNLNANPTPVYLNPATPGTKVPGGGIMIVQDPSNASRWLMTGGKAPVVTTDSGATWSFLPRAGGVAGVMTYGKVRFPRQAPWMALVSCADQGSFVITDGGASGDATYSSRTSIDRHVTFHEIMSSDDGQTLVAAGNDQDWNSIVIYRSTNGGQNWQSIPFAGLPASREGVTRAISAPGNPNDFLVLLGADFGKSNNNPGLYRTQDGGANFTKVGGSSFDGVNTGARYAPEASWLEADGVLAGRRYLSLRADGGTNTSARGLWRSEDGGTNWTKLPNQVFGTDWIHCLAVDPSAAGRLWLAGGWRGLARSNDGGDSWSTIAYFSGGDVKRVDAANGRVAVWGRRSGDTYSKLYYSADDGANWVEFTGQGERLAFTRDIAVDPWNFGQVWIGGISINVFNSPAIWHHFNQQAQFTQNYRVITANGLAWDGAGQLRHANTGGSQTSTLVYDRTPDTTPTNTGFSRGVVKIDFRVTGAGSGLGVYFYNNGNRSSSAHYRLQVNDPYSAGGTGERSRWITGANMTGSGGTTQKDTYIGTALQVGSWYRLELTLRPSGSTSADLTAKVYDRFGTTVLMSDARSLTGLAATTGEIGLSLVNASGSAGQNEVFVDNLRFTN